MSERVIYLHGFASGSGSRKARFFRERFLGAGVQLEIPDLAEGNFEDLTLSGQLRVIERTAASQAVSFMGSSMGGYLAALYAARHPEVRRMVLMAPAFGFARRWADSLGPERVEEWKRTGFLNVYHYAEDREARVGYRLMEDALTYEEYPEITQPALIFHGLKDTVVPAAASEEFAMLRPGVRLALLDSDHELLSEVEGIWTEARGFLGV